MTNFENFGLEDGLIIDDVEEEEDDENLAGEFGEIDPDLSRNEEDDGDSIIIDSYDDSDYF